MTNQVVDSRAEVDQLAEAAIAALRAPSILNTQPWRWQLTGNAAELWIDRNRKLPGLDPDGRFSLLSCGVALHHAMTALRAGGYAGAVTRFDADRPDLVARLRRGEPCPAEQTTYRAIYSRRTDRRPFADEPPTEADLEELRTAAERHGVHLKMLAKSELPALAVAVSRAGVLEATEEPFVADLTTWTQRPATSGDGVSARTVTEPGPRMIRPRTFSGWWPPGLALGTGTDRGTVYAILFTDGDEPRDWLAAGEALSDVWLSLTARGLAASPISEVVEMPSTRETLRRILGGIGYPAIALRIGAPVDPADAPPASARRPGAETIGLLGQPGLRS